MADAKHMYELTYIITPVLSDEQTQETIRRVNKLIEDNDGEIVEVEEWGSKRLAYLINKKRNGYYVNMYLKASGTMIPRLERALTIDDNLLRFLTMRMDKNMLRHYELRKQQTVAEADAS